MTYEYQLPCCQVVLPHDVALWLAGCYNVMPWSIQPCGSDLDLAGRGSCKGLGPGEVMLGVPFELVRSFTGKPPISLIVVYDH